MTRRYSFHVDWSHHDQEYVGTCPDFPSLSWLDPSPVATFHGIYRLVTNAELDILEDQGIGMVPLLDVIEQAKCESRVFRIVWWVSGPARRVSTWRLRRRVREQISRIS